jgi:hypothetical protein
MTAATQAASVTELAKDSFQAGTRHHTLTVIRDEGLYRHLRYRHDKAECAAAEARGEKPCRAAGSSYWFDLVTWPGHLAFTGDMGSYLFGRTSDEDLLAFFRGCRNINPGYWSEKVKAADPDGGVKRYSPEVFLQSVAEDAAAGEEEFPGLIDAVRAAVTGELFNAEDEWQARDFLNEFEYRPADEEARDDAPLAFRFANAWEWDLTDFGFHYLWCCYALVWGVARYDEMQASVQATAATPVVTLALPPVPAMEGGRP